VTGKNTCTSYDCDDVDKMCQAQGAAVTTKDQLHEWIDAGGSRSSTYGDTITMSGSNHWLLNGAGDYGWHSYQCCDHPNRYHVCVMSPSSSSSPSCSSGWTSLGGKCYSTSTTGQSGCSSTDCDTVEQRCANQGARLTTRGELHAWLANGGSRTSTYGATSTRSGSNHWLLNGAGDYGWHSWQCCDHPNRYYVCVTGTASG